MAPTKIAPGEIIADLRRLVILLGRQPNYTDYREHGRFGKDAPSNAFGSFRAAIEAAGFLYQGKVIDPFADLRQVAEKIGRIPGCKEYEAIGKHNRSVFYKRAPFPNWTSVLMTCFGIAEDQAKRYCRQGNHFGSYRPTEERLEELRQLAHVLRRVPSQDEAKNLGIDTRLLLRRLGGWLKTLEAAGLGKSQSIKRPGQHMTTNECQQEVLRVWNIVGRFPMQKEFQKHGRISCETVTKRAVGTKSWAALRRLMDPKAKGRKGDRRDLVHPNLTAKPDTPQNPVTQLPLADHPTPEFLKDASVNAIKDFFKTNTK